MGEIGIDRNLFLYDLQYWEIILITSGYFRRYHPAWEQARMIAHQVHYAMGCPKGESPKTPEEWVPFPWDPKESAADDDYDDDEVKRQRGLLQQYNAEHAGDTPKSNPTP